MGEKQPGRSLAYDILPGEICKINQEAYNQAKASDEKGQRHRARGLTRDTRATVMQALDGRTMMMLERAKKRGVFSNMYGTISTGKEANVYRGITSFDDLRLYGTELLSKKCITEGDLDLIKEAERITGLSYINRAIKVFKTSVLKFKDRSKYVEGEFRFRRGYLKSKNPRKMVAQWCEKEFRNLRRIVISGIRCPVPIYIKKHILVLSYIGDGTDFGDEKRSDQTRSNFNINTEKAAPRLKDVPITLGKKKWLRLYVEVVGIMHIMFNECYLIHGDMSEYNTLFYKDHVYVIDVSQSMEHDHPLALEFLKRDCINVTIFFNKVLQNRKDFDDSIVIEDTDGNSNGDAPILNDLLNSFGVFSSSLLLSPSELYKLITLIKTDELINLFEESTRSLEENKLTSSIVQIILTILEGDELTWPNFDEEERDREFTCSYLSSQKDIILGNSSRNQKVFISILYFIIHHLISNEKYIDSQFNIFDSTEETQLDYSKIKEGSNIFLNTWNPLYLNQILDRKTLEKELDRKECGEKLLYGHFLYENKKYFVENDSTEETESNASLGDTSTLESGISSLVIHCNETDQTPNGEDKEAIHLENCSESEDIHEYQNELEESKPRWVPKQFDGSIPQDIDKKEWKQMVKRENREKRQNKIPKHIKKKKKKKHLQGKRT
ncbi:RIO1 family protein [Cryptosporidium felis]|nr:RIO1 family protein [Cryptosporidium felis]